MEASSKEMLSWLRRVKGYGDFYQLTQHKIKAIQFNISTAIFTSPHVAWALTIG